ncbi:kinase non-catalytic C-lobe domain-containing protein 1 isoform X2 [Monodelphis domestica]|uniref:kinase non-catalytic C-lobe domain-containing protein 1 isoform X2 n=1 Tax=Monodelphis domestica TaxID=13616 RepID=UPI0024E249AA|nr:kinase non-catalytic C-lobe domain-containing protein 1 isoform X2 [Monodelphis domestica]
MDAEVAEPLQQQLYGGRGGEDEEEEEEEEEELDFYDFEPLPALLEDEENVSLADILSLRDSCLSEQDVWAVCLECSRSLRSIAHSAIFQSLCITPDTLAFNTNGNVCFMEQLSDDPEGAFVPPEFDVTGNTFEVLSCCLCCVMYEAVQAHVYSLGATLKAAIEYGVGAELEPRFCGDLEALLEQMQEENPSSRPAIESIIAVCEGKVQAASSCQICRDLSAVGRRVLSIEPSGPVQDVNENLWRGRTGPQSTGPKTQPEETRPEGGAPGTPDTRAGDGSRSLPPRPLAGERDDRESLSKEKLAAFFLDSGFCPGELDRGLLKKGRLRKVQTFPRLLMEAPEPGSFCMSLASGAPPARKKPPAASDLFPPDYRKLFPEGRNGPLPAKAQPKHRVRSERGAEPPGERVPPAGGAGRGDDGEKSRRLGPEPGPASPRPEAAGSPEPSGDPGREALPPLNKRSFRVSPGAERCLPSPASPAEPSGDAAAESEPTSTEQWVSLQELLSRLGRPFGEYELWALCRESLFTLQSYIEYPAYLCLDSVLVDSDGNVLFGASKDSGFYNPLYVAPEVEEQKLVTEKASVYCVAAILWTAAKFNLAPKQKLALPRKLKGLLLDMARSSAVERPSVAQAMKVCSSYLHQRGMDSKKILAHLSTSPLQVYQEEETIGLQKARPGVAPGSRSGTENATQPGAGFVPLIRDGRLVAVKGPVPRPLPACPESLGLPAAFASPATHFKPIVLAREAAVTQEGRVIACGPVSQLEGPRPAPGSADGPEGHVANEQVAVVSPDSPEAPLGSPGAQPAARPEEEPTEASGAPGPPPKDGLLPPRTLEANAASGEAPGGPDLPAGRGLSSSEPPQSRGPGPSEGRSGAAPRAEPAAGAPGQNSGLQPRGGDREADRRPAPCHSEASSGQTKPIGPSLQRVMRLIQEEFAFDGYLENGLEALIMGEYVSALKDLTFATFCGAISEKFCDLHWDEKLLQNLFSVVNGKAAPAGGVGAAAEGRGGGPAGGQQAKSEAGKLRPRASRTPGAPPSPTLLSQMDANEPSQSNFEVGFRPPQMAGGESQEHSAEGGCLQDGPGGEGTAFGPQNVAPSPCPAEFRSCSPGWCSAFYEADCFGPDVYAYVKKLGRPKEDESQNAEAPRLELEQQLMIEKRNYRKTLKFRQKLLQKEKRSRGSEVKTMLSRLKGQLEEAKAKVHFLELVKKYLQVAYAEQWGLQPWALPVIVNIAAAARLDTLDFSPLDESSSLIFYNVNKHQGNPKQKSSRVLQAGTPLGLMAYLYSSDAFLEGYVQQFLYTFRYFCTPEDFLQFLLDRINSTLSRANQDPTSTFTKIYNRSFCILQAWIEDCYTVDFTRNTGLLEKLEEFISSKVVPLDGYGEHLRSFLEVATDGKCEGPSRLGDLEDEKEADEDSRSLNALCKKLSEENLSRKLPSPPPHLPPSDSPPPPSSSSSLPSSSLRSSPSSSPSSLYSPSSSPPSSSLPPHHHHHHHHCHHHHHHLHHHDPHHCIHHPHHRHHHHHHLHHCIHHPHHHHHHHHHHLHHCIHHPHHHHHHHYHHLHHCIHHPHHRHHHHHHLHHHHHYHHLHHCIHHPHHRHHHHHHLHYHDPHHCIHHPHHRHHHHHHHLHHCIHHPHHHHHHHYHHLHHCIHHPHHRHLHHHHHHHYHHLHHCIHHPHHRHHHLYDHHHHHLHHYIRHPHHHHHHHYHHLHHCIHHPHHRHHHHHHLHHHHHYHHLHHCIHHPHHRHHHHHHLHHHDPHHCIHHPHHRHHHHHHHLHHCIHHPHHHHHHHYHHLHHCIHHPHHRHPHHHHHHHYYHHHHHHPHHCIHHPHHRHHHLYDHHHHHLHHCIHHPHCHPTTIIILITIVVHGFSHVRLFVST